MSTPTSTDLIACLDAALAAGDTDEVTRAVKGELERLIQGGHVVLPDRLRTPRPDSYARRLLHRDPGGAYTAVVMTWAPGQQTALHDHAGIWCVEGVVDGEIEVSEFELVADDGTLCEFELRGRVRASVGSAGCLIPPFEYHVMGNALAERPAVTVHVYGGELEACHVFDRRPDGRFERRLKALGYDD